MISVPSDAETSSKERVNFVSRSRTRKRKRRPPSSRSETGSGLPESPKSQPGAEDVDHETLDLDYEEHVEPLERDGVDGEEVCCEDACRLSAQKLGPARVVSLRRRSDRVARKDVAHARRRDGDAERLQFPGDPEISPTGVLPRETHDGLDLLGRQRWPRRLAARRSRAAGKRNVSEAAESLAQAGVLRQRVYSNRHVYSLADEPTLKRFIGPQPSCAPEWNDLLLVVSTLLEIADRFKESSTDVLLVETRRALRRIEPALDAHGLPGPESK
jgi:hypothetical protein